jgi:hypothetical protein
MYEAPAEVTGATEDGGGEKRDTSEETVTVPSRGERVSERERKWLL